LNTTLIGLIAPGASSRIDLICQNEEDAMSQAIALVGIHSIELWKGDKLIARFEGFPDALS
jgi:hypothetical protein